MRALSYLDVWCSFQVTNLWLWAHNVILGLFGSWALLWPVLMIYVAIITAMEKPRGSISGKIWMTVVVIVLFCTTGFIFGARDIPDGLNFFQYIAYLYTQNAGTGGGVVGGLLGTPLISGTGEVGSRIIVALLLFVAVMILTGTTLIGLFRTIKKPVDVVSEGLQNARQRREEERLILERDADIDVPLEPQLPAHPVRSEFGAGLFPPPPEKKKVEKKNDKLERLKLSLEWRKLPKRMLLPHLPCRSSPPPRKRLSGRWKRALKRWNALWKRSTTSIFLPHR